MALPMLGATPGATTMIKPIILNSLAASAPCTRSRTSAGTSTATQPPPKACSARQPNNAEIDSELLTPRHATMKISSPRYITRARPMASDSGPPTNCPIAKPNT